MNNYKTTIHVRTQYSAVPKEINIKADDKLLAVLDVLDNGDRDSDFNTEDTLYYSQAGFMSKDSGFNKLSISERKHGQDAGLFYSGIPSGTPYLNLSKFEDQGEYTYDSLLMVR